MKTHTPLSSIAEIQQLMLAAAQTVSAEQTIKLEHAVGRVLAAAQIADMDVPPYDNSAMDGYAVRHEDVQATNRLQLTQRIPAGSNGSRLLPGTTARIFTGAPIPPDCDAVVMQEEVDVAGEQILLQKAVHIGQNIRRRGEDIAKGNEILPAGHCLAPQDLGLLASIGIAEVTVKRQLRVAVFFTGDELVMPGQSLAAGQIYNSNRFMLRGLLEKLGCQIADLGNVPDQLDATRATLRQAAAENDLVLTCGGVSVGEEDHVKAAVEAEGRLDAWKIAIKPGKPLAFGHIGKVPFIGLPGNPVSAFVTFLLFARPFILRQQGQQQVSGTPCMARANFNWLKPDKRQEYLRARLSLGKDGQSVATLFPQQGSGVLTSCSWASGLVEVAPGQIINQGDWVRYYPLTEMGC
ncbi:MAG: molybdopterin molybdotransferase MoeA [Rhodocyclaceae bacterium]|mgnify:FL=1|jgi:molybdopterin molybdotransferase|nr:MAG: molybdopterin molybdotransferase MoeA [Rhodocyclaceae bacterium]